MTSDMTMATIKIKRVYEPPADSDGCRVLIDRLWPRGITREHAAFDHWIRELAPSTELRRWFGHEPDKFDEFRSRYRVELASNEDAVTPLRDLLATEEKLTLLFSAKDEAHNNAVVLAEYLHAADKH